MRTRSIGTSPESCTGGANPRGTWWTSIASLLRHAASRTGSRVLVDSSNWPSFGRLLGTATGGECGYIHLVRDPRAAIHSRIRGGRRYLLDGASAPRVTASVVQDSRRWNRWNRQAEKLDGFGTVYTRVRYEDLVRDPGATLAEVTAALDLPSVAASGNRVEIDRRHVIGGSRGARNGTVEVVGNDDWRRESTPTRRALVEVLTAPGRRRYGYGAARGGGMRLSRSSLSGRPSGRLGRLPRR